MSQSIVRVLLLLTIFGYSVHAFQYNVTVQTGNLFVSNDGSIKLKVQTHRNTTSEYRIVDNSKIFRNTNYTLFVDLPFNVHEIVSSLVRFTLKSSFSSNRTISVNRVIVYPTYIQNPTFRNLETIYLHNVKGDTVIAHREEKKFTRN